MTIDDLKHRPWWPAVEAVRRTGLDVRVWDSEHPQHFTHWDGDYAHGYLVLVPDILTETKAPWIVFVEPTTLADEDSIDDAASYPARL
jgi:hypothetical protein